MTFVCFNPSPRLPPLSICSLVLPHTFYLFFFFAFYPTERPTSRFVSVRHVCVFTRKSMVIGKNKPNPQTDLR